MVIIKQKISIIVPIYNQEKYLETAIESVLNQSIGFENIELILVDDCSTDDTKNIINEYSKKYPNIKPIFLEKNSGTPSIPKNKGIVNSTTDYVMFFDPDDYLLNDICEVLYNKILEEKCEVVSGNAIFIINNIPYYDIPYHYDKPIEITHPTKKYNDYKNFRCWGTIYDKKFLLKNDITFINVKTNEDTYFVHKCFFNAKKICYLNDYYGILYFIRKSQTLSKTYTKEVLISTINAFEQIRDLLRDMNIVFETDPFLINILSRLFTKWQVKKNDEKEIYLHMLNYINETKLPPMSPHFKFAEKLLIRKQYKLLKYYRNMIGFLLNTNIIQNKINSKNKQTISSNDKIYETISRLKNY